MATAKLSGSLLAYKDAPSNPSNGQTPKNCHESTEPALFASDSTNGPVSDQVVAVTGISGLVSPTKGGSRRFEPTLRLSLAICGIAATTAVGIVLFMSATGRSVPTIVLQSNPATPTAEQVGSPTQPATPGASASTTAASQQPPTVAATLISPHPEPISAGYAPAPIAQAAGARLSAQEVAALLTRGDALFSNGDIASARLCYERAAEAGDAQGALRLGETYDPAFLARVHLTGVRSDGTAAARWYRHARDLGAIEAEILLTGVTTNDDATNRPEEMNRLFEQFVAQRRGQTH
jgi:TPR repeat protein